MLRGSKPKPAALKLINGNPGKRPINPEVKPPDAPITRPGFVKGRAGRLWKQYAPSLESKGVLTIWDVDMFGVWCCLMAEFQKTPEQFTSAKLAQMRTLGEAFCLIPPGRARFVAREEKKDDEATAFFG